MPTNNICVLIVDDDPFHLALYAWIIQSKGYACATALVQSNTLDLPSVSQVDLVLLDYRLKISVLTPLDVVHRLRSAFASTPIVILSELEWMPDDVRGHAAAFVNKGDPKLLLDTIAAVLHGKS